MKHITRERRNKRNNKYNTRATRAANGYSKHFADYPNRLTKDQNSKLCVYGNFDHLNYLTQCYFKRISKPHPVDFGYFKETFVLTELGRKRLKTLRMMKYNNIRFWEYMHNTNN